MDAQQWLDWEPDIGQPIASLQTLLICSSGWAALSARGMLQSAGSSGLACPLSTVKPISAVICLRLKYGMAGRLFKEFDGASYSWRLPL